MSDMFNDTVICVLSTTDAEPTLTGTALLDAVSNGALYDRVTDVSMLQKPEKRNSTFRRVPSLQADGDSYVIRQSPNPGQDNEKFVTGTPFSIIPK